MWLRTKIRDAAVSVVAFGLSNMCSWDNIRISNSDNNNPQYDENWRVASINDAKKTFWDTLFVSSEMERVWERNSPLQDSIKSETKNEVIVCLETDDENSFTHTTTLESIEDPENTILEYPVDQLFKKYWKNKQSHPLAVSWVAKKLRSLLWKGGIEDSDIPQKLNPRKDDITSETLYEMWDTLRFALINHRLKWAFPENLSEQLNAEWFNTFFDKDSLDIMQRNKKVNEWNIGSTEWMLWRPERNNENQPDYIYDIVVKSLPWWKSALAVYRDWKLFMATYVSVWTVWRKTKLWQHEIIWKNPYKRSIKYENSPMPFWLNYSWWFYLHQWNVSWFPLSHWCVRLPWVYASVLYSLVKDKDRIDVFIDKNLYKSK